MASYTDRSPVFNPYIQQQPVEEMLQVGVTKQQQYDQGVERIRDSYSKIAGLDIMKDGDREYLKSKMQENTQKLRGYAASDFSNRQLTNSVTSMIGKVANDTIVQNSVYATQKVRREMDKAATAQKEGKSSVYNQADLSDSIDAWLNDGQIGSTFTGSYKPYRDVDKKLRDIYDSMSEEERVENNIFQVDSRGKTMFFKGDIQVGENEGGSPRVDKVMRETHLKGKSANKIMRNFMSSLDADDLQQLDINANYHYKNVSPEVFVNDLKNNAAYLKKIQTQSIIDIGTELETNSTMSETQRESLKSMLTRLKSNEDDNTIDKNLETQIATLNDPEKFKQYKSKLYREKYLNEKAEAMSYESVKNLIKSNEQFQADMKVKQFNFNVQSTMQSQEISREQLRLAGIRTQLAIAKDLQEQDEQNNKKVIPVLDGAIPNEPENLNSATYAVKINNINKDIDKLNNTYLNAVEQGVGPNEKLAILNNMYDAWKINAGALEKDKRMNPKVAEYIRSRKVLEDSRHDNQILYSGALNASSDLREKYKVKLNAPTGIFSVDSRGERFELTNDDLIKFTGILRSTLPEKDMSMDSPTYSITQPRDFAEKIARATKGTKFEALGRAHISGQRDPELVVALRRSFKQLTPDVKKAQHEIAQRESEYLNTKVGTVLKQTATINSKTQPSVYNDFNDLMAQKIKQYNTYGAPDTQNKNDWDPKTLNTMMQKPGVNLLVDKHPTKGITVTYQLGEEKQTIPITQEEAQTYAPFILKESAMNKLINSVNISSRGTSNKSLTGADVWSEGRISGWDLPGLQSFPNKHRFRADLIASPENKTNIGENMENNRYLIRMYYQDNNGKVVQRDLDTFSYLTDIEAQLGAINENIINEMLANK